MDTNSKRLDEAAMVDGEAYYKDGDKAGEKVPDDAPVFVEGEEFVLKGWRFKLTSCYGRKIVLKSVGPVKRERKELTKNQKRKRRRRLKR